MAKTKKQVPFAAGGTSPPVAKSVGPTSPYSRPMRWDLLILFLVISLGGTYLAIWLRPKNDGDKIGFRVVQSYPHDPKAFTQGLVYENGYLWESTGLQGQSSLRQVALKSGEIVKQVDLDEKLFGEGLALHDDRLYQLTWKNERALIYNRELEQLEEVPYSGEGWGLASNGSELIFSDGSSVIHFLDPKTFKSIRSIYVRRGGFRVGQLNELEYVGGKIFANVYQTDLVYEIDSKSGDVTSVIDLSGLWPHNERPADGVLNGIAFHSENRRLLVTGKLCPKVYEIELIPIE